MATEQLLLKAEQVAEVLSVGRSTVFEMLARGELPAVRIGRSVRIPTTALREWVEAQAQQQNQGRNQLMRTE